MAYVSTGALLDAVTAELAGALALLDRESFQQVVRMRRTSSLAGLDPIHNIDGRTVSLIATQLSMSESVGYALLELSLRELTVLQVLWRGGPAVRVATLAPAFARLLDEKQLGLCLERLQNLALLLPIDRTMSSLFVPACVRAVLLKRVGPARPAVTIFGAFRAEDLQKICSGMGIGQYLNKKADRVDAIVTELSKTEHVRQRINNLPDFPRRLFEAVVREGGAADPWSLVQKFPELSGLSKQFGYGYYLHDLYNRTSDNDGLPLLEHQGLLVRYPPDWASKLVICDEVLTALLPPVKVNAADFIEPAFQGPPARARPAGSNRGTVLDVVECLQFVDETQPMLTQRGLFAKPDSKKLSRRLSVTDAPYADFIFALMLHAGLLRQEGQLISVKRKSIHWLKAPELEQCSVLFEAWKDLREWRDDRENGYARSNWYGSVLLHRDATVRLLAELPDAGASIASISGRLHYGIPNLFTLPSPGGAPADGSSTPEGWLLGALRSLAWLGIAEPLLAPADAAPAGLRLTAIGRALLCGDQTLAGDQIPRVDRLIVQPTLDVLAPPNIEPVVYRALRGFTDPVSAAGMRTLTLNMNSLRRAVDAGQQPGAIRSFLQAHSDASLANTVDMLLADLEAKYGRIHAGHAGFYLTVDDPHLLAELGADKRLSDLIGRVIAPTVALVHTDNMNTLLERLRASGHMPVLDGHSNQIRARRGASAASTTGPIRFPAGGWAARAAASPLQPPPARTVATPRTFSAEHEREAGEDRIVSFQPRGLSAEELDGEVQASATVAASEAVHSLGAITDLCLQAVESGVSVEMEYRSKTQGMDKKTVRVVDPFEIEGTSLFAYCHLRQAEREFKLNRIIWARFTGERFAQPPL